MRRDHTDKQKTPDMKKLKCISGLDFGWIIVSVSAVRDTGEPAL
jgi:hypothetical protein